MDQMKIGTFLKALRKEKDLTQEQLAEQLNISGRTVSRWETGKNMPDISILVDLAEFYHVSIPEIIDGERKSGRMHEEVKETVLKLSDYTETVNQKNRNGSLIRRLSSFSLFSQQERGCQMSMNARLDLRFMI